MSRKGKRWMMLLGAGMLLIAGYWIVQYALEDEARLFALEAKTGHVIWSQPLDTNSELSVGNGQVYVYSTVDLPPENREYSQKAYGIKPTRTSQLSAFDVVTGRLLWEYVFDPKEHESTSAINSNPPVIGEGRIAANLNEHTLGVLDPKTGLLQWHLDQVVSPPATQSFTFAGQRILTILGHEPYSSFSVLALDTQSGTTLWQADSTNIHYSDILLDEPAITANDRLAFVSAHNSVKALDLQSGTVQFNVAADSHQIQVVGGNLYINTRSSLLAVDAVTGAPRWTFTIPGSPYLFGLQAVGQVTYIANVFDVNIFEDDIEEKKKEGAWLYALNAADGRELWRKQLNQKTVGELRMIALCSTAANSEAFFITLEVENHDSTPEDYLLTAFSAVDGAELWHFWLKNGYSPVVNDKLVFVTDRAARWQNWLSSINSAWRNQ